MIIIPRKYWYGLVLCTTFLLFYANNSLLITDSVESNYALTAKEMLSSGDWISPQIYGQYWFDKPVLFYVLTAFSYLLFGCTEFASRFFPSIFGLAGVCLIAWGGCKLYSERAGFYSALVLASSFEFFLISKSVITDAVLFFFFSLALLCFMIAYTRKRTIYYYGFYVGCAFAVLTKGPIGLLLPGLIVFLFLLIRRNFAELKKMKIFSGTFIFLLIALPWYIAMYTLHGSAFIDVFFGTHNFLRATVSEHPKDNVIYYYTLVTLLAVFPWAGFLPQMVKNLFRSSRKKYVMKDESLFLLLWMATIFVFFQCMATKYITYTYPLLFPVALLLGRFFDEKEEKISFVKPVLWNAFFFTIFIALAFYAAKVLHLPIQSVWHITAPVVIGTIIVFSTKLLKKKTYILLCIALTAFFFNIFLIRDICLPLAELRSAKTPAVVLQGLPESESVYVYGYYPTSVVFYSDKKVIKLVPTQQLQNFQPQSFSWSSKNVMPYAEFTAVEKNNSVILLQEKEYFRFVAECPVKDWNITMKKDGWVILKRG